MKALVQIAVYKLDLEDFESVRAFCREFDEKEEHIDVLVNNAGCIWPFLLCCKLISF